MHLKIMNDEDAIENFRRKYVVEKVVDKAPVTPFFVDLINFLCGIN